MDFSSDEERDTAVAGKYLFGFDRETLKAHRTLMVKKPGQKTLPEAAICERVGDCKFLMAKWSDGFEAVIPSCSVDEY